jgi:hypothetical protein
MDDKRVDYALSVGAGAILIIGFVLSVTYIESVYCNQDHLFIRSASYISD